MCRPQGSYAERRLEGQSGKHSSHGRGAGAGLRTSCCRWLRLRDRLQYVPVLDGLDALEPEDVGHRHTAVVGCHLEQVVSDDKIALRDGAFDLQARLRKLLGEPLTNPMNGSGPSAACGLC